MATPPGQIEDDLRVAQRLTPLTAEEKKAVLPRAVGRKFDSIRGPALEYGETRSGTGQDGGAACRRGAQVRSREAEYGNSIDFAFA